MDQVIIRFSPSRGNETVIIRMNCIYGFDNTEVYIFRGITSISPEDRNFICGCVVADELNSKLVDKFVDFSILLPHIQDMIYIEIEDFFDGSF